MKKIIAIAIGMLLVPFTAFGMETATDESMEGVQGQSGVAITVDDVLIYSQGDDEVWFQNNRDTDEAAAVGLRDTEDSASLTFINAILADEEEGNVTFTGDYGDKLDYGEQLDDLYDSATGGEDGYVHTPSALTIQVSNALPIIQEATGGEVAGVAIGLPTVEIYNEEGDAMDIMMSTAADPTAGEADDEHRFGTLYTGGGGGMAILSGSLEIAPLSDYAAAAGDDNDG